MATLFIAEFGVIQAYPDTSSAQVVKTPPVALQSLALSSSASTSCAAFNGNTQIVRLYADTQCWVTFSAIQASTLGTTVATATATSIPLGAAAPEYFGVVPGQVVAALSIS